VEKEVEGVPEAYNEPTPNSARYSAAARKAMEVEDGSWEGAGGYRYSMSGDNIRVIDRNGQITFAKPGTTAFKAIMDEKGEKAGPAKADGAEAAPKVDGEGTTTGDLKSGEGTPARIAGIQGTTTGDLKSGEGTPARIAGIQGTTTGDLKSGEGTPARIAGIQGTTTGDLKSGINVEASRLAGIQGSTEADLKSGEGTPARIAGIQGTTAGDLRRPTVLEAAQRALGTGPAGPAGMDTEALKAKVKELARALGGDVTFAAPEAAG
jgi:hypothetical protein